MTRRATRLLVTGVLLLGAGLGIVLWGAFDLVATGYRIDDEGTSSRLADDLLGWGGLVTGLSAGVVGAILLAVDSFRSDRERDAGVPRGA